MVLSLPPLLAFSFTLCTALCMQMKHPNAAGTTQLQPVSARGHELTTLTVPSVPAPSDTRHSHRDCCSDQHGIEKAITPPHRILPEEVTTAVTEIEAAEVRLGLRAGALF